MAGPIPMDTKNQDEEKEGEKDVCCAQEFQSS